MKTILLAVLAAVASGVALAADSGEPAAVIHACKHPSGGWLRQVAEETQCRRRETRVSWNVQGSKGDPGEPGAPGPQGKGDKGDPGTVITGLKTLEGVPCVAEDSAAGEIKVTVGTGGDVTLTCEAAPDQPPPPPPPPPAENAKLVINEVDYDQVGADGNGFVEIHNTGGAAADLANVDLVAVNGGDGSSTTGSRSPARSLPAATSPLRSSSRTARLTGSRCWKGRRCSTLCRTRARSRRPRSAARRTTSSRALPWRRPSRTPTPSPARSSATRTARTRTTQPRTGPSPRRSPERRRTRIGVSNAGPGASIPPPSARPFPVSVRRRGHPGRGPMDPRGRHPHRSGSVATNSDTVGVPSAAARCTRPVSTPMTSSARASRAASAGNDCRGGGGTCALGTPAAKRSLRTCSASLPQGRMTGKPEAANISTRRRQCASGHSLSERDVP